jgi:putative ABC transport system permease protein
MKVLITALGIGATTILYSLVYGVLERPLPWPEANRIVRISETREGSTHPLPPLATNATYMAWRDHPTTIASLAAYDTNTMTLTGAGDPDRLTVVTATAGLFDLLRVRPATGAAFTEANEAPGNDHVAVLSYGLWQQRFGGRTDIIGTPVRLDGAAYTITGVMPQGFYFPDPSSAAWIPFQVVPVVGNDPTGRSLMLFDAIARLRPDATPAQAAAEATARSRTAPDLGMVGVAVFGTRGPAVVSAVPYLDAITADVRPALLLLMAAVGLLLLVALANVAGIHLAQSLARRREMALRAALGAGWWRLARHLLAGSLRIGLAGGLGGLLLAFWLHSALPSLLPADFPRVSDVAVDWHAAAVATAAALLASLVFSLLPVLFARNVNLVEALNEDSLAPVGAGLRSRAGRARALIMAGQVAVTAMLLVGAALLVRSFVARLDADRGYDPHNVLTAEVALPGQAFTGPRRAAFMDALLGRLRQVPGVSHAAVSTIVPLLHRESLRGFQMPSPRDGQLMPVQTSVRVVSPDYFAAMGMRLVEGRDFLPADTPRSMPVAVVNQAFVARYLAGTAVGVELPTSLEDGKNSVRIVGVVEDVRQHEVTDPPQPELFYTYRQLNAGLDADAPVVVARTSGRAADLVPLLRSFVREQDPTVALQSVMTMEQRLEASLAKPRLYAFLLGAFAAFALLVSGIGLFGVLSYNVAQRSRELGVRVALGARPIDIVGLVVRQGLTVTLAGAAVGLGVALLLGGSVRGLVFGVTTHDALTFVAVPLALALVAAVACSVPARRAARVDPLAVLKGAR